MISLPLQGVRSSTGVPIGSILTWWQMQSSRAMGAVEEGSVLG